MSAIKDPVTPVVRETVADDARMDFLPDRVGAYFLPFENAVYDTLSSWTGGEYAGGYWEFYTLSNGGWYLAPRGDAPYRFRVPGNYFEGDLSPDAAGIAVSLTVINHLLWGVHARNPSLGERLTTAFYALREYAAEHPEAAAIFGAID